MRHPATYSAALLPVLAEFLPARGWVLDPFAGTGKIGLLRAWRPDLRFVGVELEAEWAAWGKRYGIAAQLGNACRLPFRAVSFEGICTSPAYGNRMADGFTDHQVAKAYQRNTYRHALGRLLSPGSGAALQWGDAYRALHGAVWAECARVLAPGGVFVLNCKDHIRAGVVQEVTAWHVAALTALGFREMARRAVTCPGNRQGANGAARVAEELVIGFCYDGWAA